jgi:hypothetical protein
MPTHSLHLENVLRRLPSTDCVEWPGSLGHNGYAQSTVGGVKWRMHRCGSHSTWCVYVSDQGRHDRYCDACQHEWATRHASANREGGEPRG